jgi:hypothetical protein
LIDLHANAFGKRIMDNSQFWGIIRSACRSGPESSEQWNGWLIDELAQLPPDEMMRQHLPRLAALYSEHIWLSRQQDQRPPINGSRT